MLADAVFEAVMLLVAVWDAVPVRLAVRDGVTEDVAVLDGVEEGCTAGNMTALAALLPPTVAMTADVPDVALYRQTCEKSRSGADTA